MDFMILKRRCNTVNCWVLPALKLMLNHSLRNIDVFFFPSVNLLLCLIFVLIVPNNYEYQVQNISGIFPFVPENIYKTTI